jgi:hypothetical protein
MLSERVEQSISHAVSEGLHICREENISVEDVRVVKPIQHEYYEFVSEFDLGPQPILNGIVDWHLKYPKEAHRHHIYVKRMLSGDPAKPIRWSIVDESECCLNKSGIWVYQGLPSTRLDDFYKENRYDSYADAIEYYQKWSRIVKDWAKGKEYCEVEDCPSNLSYHNLMSE